MHTLAPSAKNLTYVQSARWSFRKPQGARQHFFFHHESRRRLNLEVASQANTHKIIIERGTSPDFPILGLRLHAHYHSTPKYMANIVRSAKSGSDRTWKDRAAYNITIVSQVFRTLWQSICYPVPLITAISSSMQRLAKRGMRTRIRSYAPWIPP